MTQISLKTLRAFRELTDSELIELLFKMAEAHPATFTALVDGNAPVILSIPDTDRTITLTKEEHTELLAFPRDRKVSCIKRIRELTGVGLKEAKDISEAHFGMNSQYDPYAFNRTGY